MALNPELREELKQQVLSLSIFQRVLLVSPKKWEDVLVEYPALRRGHPEYQQHIQAVREAADAFRTHRGMQSLAFLVLEDILNKAQWLHAGDIDDLAKRQTKASE